MTQDPWESRAAISPPEAPKEAQKGLASEGPAEWHLVAVDLTTLKVRLIAPARPA